MALLKSLTDNGLTYAEISIKSGIRANFELEFVPYGVLWDEITGWIG